VKHEGACRQVPTLYPFLLLHRITAAQYRSTKCNPVGKLDLNRG
jgi:hypothetical protein